MAAIVRAIWGDNDFAASRFDRAWRDLSLAVQRESGYRVIIYCYGKRNADALTAMRVPTVLVDDDPYGGGWREFWSDGFHVTPWVNKIKLLRVALDDYDELIYLDSDVHIVSDPQMAFGHHRNRCWFQCSLFRYAKDRAVWRDSMRKEVISGSVLYLRGKDAADWLKSIERGMEGGESKPSSELWWHDEIVMTRLLDDMLGWYPHDQTTNKRWLDMYESPCHLTINSRSPWGRASLCPDGTFRREHGGSFRWHPIFQSRGRWKWQERHRSLLMDR